MRKPRWLSDDTWIEFCARWRDSDGVIRCVVPGCQESDEDNLFVDHLVSRFLDGTDALSNLQPMCRNHNSQKSYRDDAYWKKLFFFDRPLHVGGLRVSQRDFVFNVIIEKSKFFSQAFSLINGKLFCIIQIVGAGKTLGMLCLPFAINRCVRTYHSAQARVDRMLIVTKDTALRSQIANEIQTECVKYGITSEPPAVTEITDGRILLDSRADYDIGVMCPNMLWPHIDVNNEKMAASLQYSWSPGIDQVVHRHPLIVFDEMHYAHGSLRQLLRAARNSLIFGFTGSPINRFGELLEDMVKVSVYTYRDAMASDGSMKYVS
jgi:hypothetical protein